MFNPLSPANNLDRHFMPKCPICGSKQDYLEMSVIEDSDNNSLVYINCKKCSVSLIGIVNFSPMGISVVSFATDLQKSEIAKLRKGKRVSEDDVLDIHQMLEDKTINFVEMIK